MATPKPQIWNRDNETIATVLRFIWSVKDGVKYWKLYGSPSLLAAFSLVKDKIPNIVDVDLGKVSCNITRAELGISSTANYYFKLAYVGFNNQESVKSVSIELATASSSTDTFITLTDAPSSYSGAGGLTVKVKVDETGLEFVV